MYWVVRVTWCNDWETGEKAPTNNEYICKTKEIAEYALNNIYTGDDVEYACITLGD